MHVSPVRRLASLAVLAAVPVIVATAEPWPPVSLTQEQATTLVTVDFRALTRDGIPVRDLEPADIVLKVGSRTREIVALELVKAGGDNPAAAAKAAPAPPFVTNAPLSGGRSVMLLVDDEAIPPGQEAPVKDALGQLVAALTPEDQVGVMTLKGGVVVHPTLRHERVLADIAGLRGIGSPPSGAALAPTRGTTSGPAGGTDPACRTRTVHDAMMNQFERAVPSVPTVVVLVSNGLAAPGTPTLTAIGNVNTQGSATGSPCEFTSGDLSALTTAAARAHVHVFGLEVFLGADVSGGFENFANLTGNARIRLSGDTGPAMKRLASETSAYYVAAFEVTDDERTGSSQRVSVTVSRPGVDVKAQPTVFIAKPAAPPGTKGAKADKPKLRDLLASGKVFRDLPLRATVYTSRMVQAGKMTVVCAFDLDDPSAKLAEASVILFDTTGKAKAQWTGQPAAFKANPVVAMFAAPGPGTYRMRLAAIDASGAAGTIDEDVRVEAVSPGSAQASALVLGTQDSRGFAPRLEFADEKVATAAVEIYGVSKPSVVEAKFEFAATEDGPAAAALPGTVQAAGDDVRTAFVSFPIAQMPAGDFVVRAVITVDGQPLAAKPIHTMRKVGR
jgi:hypothetical protein